MNTISCIVVDDEPLAVRLMESYVAKTPFLSLKGSFTSGTAAYSFLQDNPVDLLFCDIQMPNLSGMDLSRMLPEGTRIIFTTAFSEYAVEGFKVRALDYLLKPISYEDFLSATVKAKEYFEVTEPAEVTGQRKIKSIFVKTEYRLQQIDLLESVLGFYEDAFDFSLPGHFGRLSDLKIFLGLDCRGKKILVGNRFQKIVQGSDLEPLDGIFTESGCEYDPGPLRQHP